MAKNIAKIARRQPDGMTSAIWRIFAVLKTTFLPKLADIQVTEDEVNVNGGKHVKF